MYNYTFFYGSALLRIIQDQRIRKIKLYASNNSYLVNDSACVYLKHSTKRLTPWRFTFSNEHTNEIRELHSSLHLIYIVLICNDNGICCLDYDELCQLIFIGDSSTGKWVGVSRSPREKYTVHGSDGKLKYKIGNNEFPDKVFSRILNQD